MKCLRMKIRRHVQQSSVHQKGSSTGARAFEREAEVQASGLMKEQRGKVAAATARNADLVAAALCSLFI